MADKPADTRLGALMVLFEIITKKQLESAVLISTGTSLPLGKAFVLSDCASRAVIQDLVEIQSMLRDKQICMDTAKKAVKQSLNEKIPLSESLKNSGVDPEQMKRTRVGELLVNTGNLEERTLEKALKVNSQAGLPLGQTLHLMGAVSSSTIDSTLELQRKLRCGNPPAGEVIGHLQKLKSPARITTGRDKLRIGKIIVNSGLMVSSEMEAVARSASRSSTLLGEQLIKLGLIEAKDLDAALRLQSLIKEKNIDYEKACSLLKESCKKSIPIEKLLEKEKIIPSEKERNFSFFQFLKFAGYLDKDIEGKLNKHFFPSELHTDAQELNAALIQICPQDKDLLETALSQFELIQEGKKSIRQAIVDFALMNE